MAQHIRDNTSGFWAETYLSDCWREGNLCRRVPAFQQRFPRALHRLKLPKYERLPDGQAEISVNGTKLEVCCYYIWNSE